MTSASAHESEVSRALGAAGALLRLEAYLDTVSGTRPSQGLLHPLALVFASS